MGICSAKTQNQISQPENKVDQPKQCLQITSKIGSERVIKSEQNIKSNMKNSKIDATSTPSQFKKQFIWADQIVDKDDQRNTLKTYIAVKSCQFSKYYSVIQSKGDIKVKQYEQLALVQHNLSGKIRLMELINKNNKQLVQSITQNQLIHPNLIRIFEIFQDQKNYQIIHDYCVGGPLDLYLKKQQLSEQQIALLFKQMLEIIQYLHQYQVTHCGLHLNSFEKCNQTETNYIKLIDYKSIFMKDYIQNNIILNYISPEALAFPETFTPERDIWSLGILLYRMITNKFPFKGQNEEDLMISIKDYASNSEFDQNKLTKSAYEYIKKFLQIDPKKRIKLNEALNDNWLKKSLEKSIEEQEQIVKQFDQSKKLTFLQTCFLQFMISQFNSEQEQKFYTLFREFDRDNKGKINKQDLIQIYMKHFSSLEEVNEHVNSVFKSMDINNNGTIDFQEFLIGAIDKINLITEENVKQTFKLLADVEGHITLNKLCLIYQNKKQKLKQQFIQYENNQINFQQFQKVVFDII